ncbi:ATP-dependent DNA ligase [Candidatus Dependentiae bacterium]|nr:ATP-dependent DNA ligase [Candidatus Dependentiae bacterium]
MTFHELAEQFSRISLESSRLKIMHLLADVFAKVGPQEAQHITYLSLGTVRPAYQGNQFNFAEKNLIKTLASLVGSTPELYTRKVKESGDIGLAILAADWPYTDHSLSVEQVYHQLVHIESLSGTGVQEEKIHLLGQLLKKMDALSASYVVRIIMGTMRLGFSDMTVIDALSWMMVSSKALRPALEEAFNIRADLGFIAHQIKHGGAHALEAIKPTLGVPIRPAAAERAESPTALIEKIGPCVAQPKLDGFRLQIHLNNRDLENKQQHIWFFSRNLLDMSPMFPDLTKALETCAVQSLIVEGEAIVYDEENQTYVAFQETVKRKRKHAIEEAVQNLPLHLFLFDILYYNGEILLSKPHSERRALLGQLFSTCSSPVIHVIEEKHVTTAAELDSYFKQTVSAGLEGLVAKRPNAPYQAGKRNFNWIKLKRHEQGYISDTIDAVILGYYTGRGKRAHFGVGAFLVGVYNAEHDRFETIAKIGTGLTDQEWRDLKKLCDAQAVVEQPHNVVCASELVPDVWVQPTTVVVIRADEITQSPLHTAGATKTELGFALRFPRFMGYSVDKTVTQATAVSEIKELYKQQFSAK